MFVENKYLKHYNTLCGRARERSVTDVYTERHHVIPKSLGGSDEPSNIVVLTAREHYIAHMILPRITEGSNRHKMINAWFRMTCQGTNPFFSFINSRRFEQARKTFASTAGWALRGKSYEEIHGVVKAYELKQARSNAKSLERKGKTWDDIFGAETAARMRGLRSEQSKAWNTGRKHNDETKKLISEAAQTRVYHKIACVCGRHISSHNIHKHQSSCQAFSEGKYL